MRDENTYKQKLSLEINFRDKWHNIWCMIVVKKELKDTNIYIYKDNKSYIETDDGLFVSVSVKKKSI